MVEMVKAASLAVRVAIGAAKPVPARPRSEPRKRMESAGRLRSTCRGHRIIERENRCASQWRHRVCMYNDLWQRKMKAKSLWPTLQLMVMSAWQILQN